MGNKNNFIVIDTSVLVSMLKGEESWKIFESYLSERMWIIPFAAYTEIGVWFMQMTNKEERIERSREWQGVLANCEIVYPDQAICDEAVKRAYDFRKRRKRVKEKEVTIDLIEKEGYDSHRRHWSDIWIASCASVLDIALVTNDGKWRKWFPDLEIFTGDGQDIKVEGFEKEESD